MSGRRLITPVRNMSSQGGYLLVLVMAATVALMAIAAAVMSVSSTKYAKTASDSKAASAIYVAEAGITDTINRLGQNAAFGGYTKKQFYSDTTQGKAEYTTKVDAGANGTLIVTSTGYLSALPSSPLPFATRTVKVILTQERTPITENVVAGSAGLTVVGSYYPWGGQSSGVQKGSVYSRGKIRLGGASGNIGSPTESVKVTTPNIGCGNASNFPQQCAATDPPFQFTANWFSGAGTIYGTVCGTDQPASTHILPGSTGAGRIDGCIAPDYGMPYFDKKTFTSNKGAGMSNAAASTCGSTWGTNNFTRIEGDVTLQGGLYSECAATIAGDVYIKGNLTLDRNARLNVDASLTTAKPIIVVNGRVTIANNATGVFANASGTYLTLLSFWSTDTACSTHDECTSINSTNLYTSSMQGAGTSGWGSPLNRAISIGVPGGIANSAPVVSGLSAYSYFGSTIYALPGQGSIRGLGGQEVVINPGGVSGSATNSVSITESSPFAHVLQRTKYIVGDYLQTF